MAYDKPITIQVQDENTEQWADSLHLHAKVNKTGGSQALNAGADQYRASLTFDISEHFLFNKNQNCLRVTEGFDVMEADTSAYIYGSFEASEAVAG